MIRLYTAATGNGRRAAIAVAESGLPYTVRVLDLARGEQRESWYRAINPIGQIPAIVDEDGSGGAPVTVTQSAAIMFYLAEKTGRHLPAGGPERVKVLERFLHVCADIAGINAALTLGSNEIAEPDRATLSYFEGLLMRHFEAIDDLLADGPWLAGELSIADLALYPHFDRRLALIQAGNLGRLLDWGRRVGERPLVQLGMSLSVT